MTVLKRNLVHLYFCAKSVFFGLFQHFERKVWCRHHAKKNQRQEFCWKLCKKGVLVQLYFCTNSVFSELYQNFGRPRFNSFVENAAKKVFWFRYLCRKTAFLTLSESFTRKLWRRVSTSITEELTVRVCWKSCKDLRFLRTSHFLNNFFSFVRLHY